MKKFERGIGMVLKNLWCHIEALQATNTSHFRPYIYLSSLTPDTLLTSLPSNELFFTSVRLFVFRPVSVRACTDDRPACAGEPYRRHAAQRLDDTGHIGDSLCWTGVMMMMM